MSGKTKVDLTKTDKYEDYVVPDEHLEICLKVLRTVRNYCLGPDYFNAESVIVLSHAHAILVEMVAEVIKVEAEEDDGGVS